MLPDMHLCVVPMLMGWMCCAWPVLQEREADPGQVLPEGRRVGRRGLLHGGHVRTGAGGFHLGAQEENWSGIAS